MEFFEESLSIKKQLFGDKHISLAFVLYNISLIF